jgi:methylated-DNA-protein-cysteine methyltransferase related protein
MSTDVVKVPGKYAMAESPREVDEDCFYSRVWDVVAQIPIGKVTTYGHIAERLGSRRSARMVGWALNAAADSPVPCHRVVNRFGGLSGSMHFGGPSIMEDMLRNEGVTFDNDGCVRLDRHLWAPDEAVEKML